MIGTNISFAKEKNGYDRAQVDSYIKKISEAYQTTYYEFLDISGKYKSLLEDRENSGKQEQSGMNPDIAAKTLINTELLAQKIIADAQAEAGTFIEEARKLKENANTESAKVREEAQRIIDNAHSETAKAREEAQKIINNANNEAEMLVTQIRIDIERARRIMSKAAIEVEDVLTLRLEDKELAAAA